MRKKASCSQLELKGSDVILPWSSGSSLHCQEVSGLPFSCTIPSRSLLTTSHLFPGEIFELKAELNNEKKEKRKEAVKKVIAAMTVGKDVR